MMTLSKSGRNSPRSLPPADWSELQDQSHIERAIMDIELTIGHFYEVTFEGSTKKFTMYFNIYEKGVLACPKGFKIKKK